MLFYFFVLVTFQSLPLTRPQICEMESFCVVQQQGGEPHLKLPIMTDCFTAVVTIHKEGKPSLIRGPRPPCVGVLQTCSASQLIYINIRPSASCCCCGCYLFISLPTHACTPSPSFLPRLPDHYGRQEGRGRGWGGTT